MRKLLILIAVVAIFSCRPAGDPCAVKICGSTTVYPIIKDAVNSLSGSVKSGIELSSTGSVGGYKSLLSGECDICDSSYRLTPEELNSLAAKNITLKEFVIGYDIVIPVVHLSNPLNEISAVHLKDIFTGAVTSWKEVKGADTKITTVCRDGNSGTANVWNEKFLQMGNCSPKCIRSRSNSESLSIVAHDPSAIGYISRAFLNSEVKELKITGLSTDTASLKKHPGFRKLYLYVNEKNQCPAARSLAVFLMSKEGRELVLKNGFIPPSDSVKK
jgi:phosphate transport system substrate-binding protein